MKRPSKSKKRWLWSVALGCCFLAAGSARAQEARYPCVAQNDCGVEGRQAFLIKGENYTMPASLNGSKEAQTCNFGGKVIYAFDQLDINASYQLEVVYLSDSERTQRIVADGNEVQPPVVLHAGKEQRYLIDLPKKAYAYGQLVLVFEVLKGPNAIVSELNLYASTPQKPKPFTGDKKLDLARTQTYRVDTTVNAEDVLPVYAPKPSQVAGVYQPVLSLNGIWQFKEKAGSQTPWQPIVVPGEWAMQGFKVDSAGFASYQTKFTLPDDWKGKRVRIRFDGVSSESVIYLNGKKAGAHLGGMTAFELDITPHLIAGENTLALDVRSESMADMLGSLTQYAAHQLGGITRKVTLMALPELYLSDMRIVTDLDSLYNDAQLKVYASVINQSSQPKQDVSLQLTLEGLPASFHVQLPELAPGERWSGWVNGHIDSPRKWDSEHPNLYTLRLALQESDKALEIVNRKFGFREIEVVGNRLCVNGTPVKLRGVCRHEMHPLTGRVVTPELARRDVELYRDANCNFIRTSHYPPCEELLEACDELGMFVELEAPVCWVGHHANENWKTLNYRDSTYYPYILQANMETIHFYRNHPSVLFWSMANESYWNKGFAQVEVYVEKADPTRPHTFHDQAYGGFNNQGSTAPIANIHYPGPDGYKVAAKSDRPMIYGEYCHLNVYNRSELVTDPGIRSDWALALAPTWENMYKTDGVLGGSIWSGIDDIFQLPDGNAVGYGAWGPIDGWRRPKPEYWDMKKTYSPVRVRTTALQPARTLTLDVANRYSFTNLNELRVNWQYGDERGVASIECAPGDSTQFSLSIAHPEKANGLQLVFTDPRGFIVDEYLIPVGEQSQNVIPALPRMATRLKEKNDRYVITGKGFDCQVSRATGQILSLSKNGKELLKGGPWLMALPLTGGGCYPNHNTNTPPFNAICSAWKADKVEAQETPDGVQIHVSGTYKEFKGAYTLLICANGELTVEYAFDAIEEVNPRQWGLVFEAPSSFKTAYWRRKGLWSVYPEDHISRPAGEAKLFYAGLPQTIDPRVSPSWSWSYDFNELGSNDFRSTRRNIWYAGLKDEAGNCIVARSNGKQHWRSWLEGGVIRFLVADFATPGDELFLSSYYAPYRKPLKAGDRISGCIQLQAQTEDL